MDVLVRKIESIERCLRRIGEEYEGDARNLANPTRQDSIVLNLQRACEQSIDLANLIIPHLGLETPRSSRNAFEILAAHDLIDTPMRDGLKRMVGFRNIAIHEYQRIDSQVLNNILAGELGLFHHFSEHVRNLVRTNRL